MTESFHAAAFGTNRNQDLTRVFIQARKDGKYRATYCFDGRKITKIRTAEQIDTDRTSGKYLVVSK